VLLLPLVTKLAVCEALPMPPPQSGATPMGDSMRPSSPHSLLWWSECPISSGRASSSSCEVVVFTSDTVKAKPSLQEWARSRCFRCLAQGHQVNSCTNSFCCIRCHSSRHRERQYRFLSHSTLCSIAILNNHKVGLMLRPCLHQMNATLHNL
jgi:hypothetical protein